MQGHFLKHVVEFLNHNNSPSVLDVYTPCQGEQGITDPLANRHGRVAVESRMNPLFVHDPRRGGDLHSRFSLEGNPAIDKDWTTTTLEYVEDGATKLMDVPLTPADFALTEGRFKKQFRPLKGDAVGVPLHEYIDLGQADRIGKTPFVWSVDEDKKLVKIEVASTVVALVEERRRHWRTLQYLAGQDVARLDANHHLELETLRRQYEEAVDARESSIELDRAGDVRTRRFVEGAAGRRPVLGARRRSRRRRPGAARGGEVQRRGGVARRGGRRQVHQLQDLLPGASRAVREDPGRRRRRGQGSRSPDRRRARARHDYAGTQEQDRSCRRQL